MLRCPRCHWLLPDGVRGGRRCPACDETLCGRVLRRARRGAPRLCVRLSAWTRVAGGPATRAVIWDLSTTGARWWGNRFTIRPQETVSLEIAFPGRAQSLTVRARAVWVSPSADGAWCGVRFLKVPDAGFLARYLASREKALPIYRRLMALS